MFSSQNVVTTISAILLSLCGFALSAQISYSDPILLNKDCQNLHYPTFHDLDADGDLDIIFQNHSCLGLEWFQNDGTGLFNGPFIIANGFETPFPDRKNYILADMDHDGTVDILFVNLDTNEIVYFSNTGNGTFAAAETLFASAIGSYLVAADFNQDGYIDICNSGEINFNYLEYQDGIYVLQNESNLTGADNPEFLAVDFDFDGDLDIVFISNSSLLLKRFESGGFTTNESIPQGYSNFNERWISLLDIDNDGCDDIFNSHRSSDGKPSWYRQECANSFEALAQLSNFEPPNFSFYDLDSDELLDILWKDNNGLYWIKNLGSGQFATEQTYLDNLGNGDLIFAGNLDDDPEMEVITEGFTSRAWRIHHFTSSGQLDSSEELFNLQQSIQSSDFVELNEDGNIDLVLSGYGFLKIYFGDGNFQFENVMSLSTADLGQSLTIQTFFVDVDNDGLKDIAYHNQSVAWMRNLGGGAFANPETLFYWEGYDRVYFNDFNGDGLIDVYTERYSNSTGNEAGIMLGVTNSPPGELLSVEPHEEYFIDIKKLDLNSNGASTSVGISESGLYNMQFNQETNALDIEEIKIFDDPLTHIAFGDLNQDGLTDFAGLFEVGSSRQLQYHRNVIGEFETVVVDANVYQSAYASGLNAIKDYNGDGRPDIKIFRDDIVYANLTDNTFHQFQISSEHTLGNFDSNNDQHMDAYSIGDPVPDDNYADVGIFVHPTDPSSVNLDFRIEGDCAIKNFYNYSYPLWNTTVEWDFGDGTFSNDYHYEGKVYEVPGEYEVVLTVCNVDGCTSSSQTVDAVQDIELNIPESGVVGESLSFSYSSDGITNQSWIFSNGYTSIEPTVSIVFDEPGIYDLELILTNANVVGCTVYVVEQITIEAASGITAIDVEPNIQVAAHQISIQPSIQFDFASCQLFSIDGRLLSAKATVGDESKLVFSNVSRGAYLIVFQRDGADAITRKVIVH